MSQPITPATTNITDVEQPVIIVNDGGSIENDTTAPEKSSSTNVIKDSTHSLDSFEVRTVPNQISNYAAAYVTWAGAAIGYGEGEVERLKPGEIYKPKKPDTFLQVLKWWQATDEFAEFGGMFSHAVLQFQLLYFCNFWKKDILSNDDDPYYINGTRYCYDNVFADIELAGGKAEHLEGALKYYDLFTWEGWATAIFFGALKTFFEEMIWNVLILIFFTIFWQNVPNMTICDHDDVELEILGQSISLCFWTK